MNPGLACPDRDTLHQLLLGHLPAPRGEQLVQHLEQCPHCSTVVQSLSAHDTLVEPVRAQATTVDGLEKEAVSRLIERLRPPEVAAAVLSTSDVPTRGADESPPTDDGGEATLPPRSELESLWTGDGYDFLPPPEGPGELGRLETYCILKVLGAGGMGAVFQAEDVQLRRLVALKVMRPEVAGKAGARERFLREAQAAVALTHDHIVPIYTAQVDPKVQIEKADPRPK
jgi:anti-sigma factor RsiW